MKDLNDFKTVKASIDKIKKTKNWFTAAEVIKDITGTFLVDHKSKRGCGVNVVFGRYLVAKSIELGIEAEQTDQIKDDSGTLTVSKRYKIM